MWMYDNEIINENDLETSLYHIIEDDYVMNAIDSEYGSITIGGRRFDAGDIVEALADDMLYDYKTDMAEQIANEMNDDHEERFEIKWVEYKPIATDITVDDDGCCVWVEDDNGVLPSMWIDVWIRDSDISSDFNQFVFNNHNKRDRMCWAIQHSEAGGDILVCAEEYAIEKGLITQNNDGTWTFNGEVE